MNQQNDNLVLHTDVLNVTGNDTVTSSPLPVVGEDRRVPNMIYEDYSNDNLVLTDSDLTVSESGRTIIEVSNQGLSLDEAIVSNSSGVLFNLVHDLHNTEIMPTDFNVIKCIIYQILRKSIINQYFMLHGHRLPGSTGFNDVNLLSQYSRNNPDISGQMFNEWSSMIFNGVYNDSSKRIIHAVLLFGRTNYNSQTDVILENLKSLSSNSIMMNDVLPSCGNLLGYGFHIQNILPGNGYLIAQDIMSINSNVSSQINIPTPILERYLGEHIANALNNSSIILSDAIGNFGFTSTSIVGTIFVGLIVYKRLDDSHSTSIVLHQPSESQGDRLLWDAVVASVKEFWNWIKN
jgi:hypothetical protein